MIREVEMSGELDKDDFLLLSSKDRANGLSIVADDRHNITLFKWGKPTAWFSSAVTGELLREFVELVKDREKSAKEGNRKDHTR